MNASVENNGVLLDNNLLLNECVDLLFEEVNLVDVVDLQLLEVLLQVGNILNDLLQDVVGCFCGVMLKSCALASQELHFLLVVIEQLNRIFRGSL